MSKAPRTTSGSITATCRSAPTGCSTSSTAPTSITVSWNHFHDHHKTCLLGHSDKDDVRQIDTGHLRVTYHHNFFDGTKTRHPRVRYAEPVHVFNNYFKNNEYGVAALMDSGVLVEGNVFENVEHPTHTQYGDSPGPGRLVERDNLYIKSGTPK